jgi:hypothetical protein
MMIPFSLARSRAVVDKIRIMVVLEKKRSYVW